MLNVISLGPSISDQNDQIITLTKFHFYYISYLPIWQNRLKVIILSDWSLFVITSNKQPPLYPNLPFICNDAPWAATVKRQMRKTNFILNFLSNVLTNCLQLSIVFYELMSEVLSKKFFSAKKKEKKWPGNFNLG